MLRNRARIGRVNFFHRRTNDTGETPYPSRNYTGSDPHYLDNRFVYYLSLIRLAPDRCKSFSSGNLQGPRTRASGRIDRIDRNIADPRLLVSKLALWIVDPDEVLSLQIC